MKEPNRKLVLLFNGISATFADTDNAPSFSLMALSAFLKHNGYDCRLLLNRHSDSDLSELLSKTLAVGFSVYTGTGLMHSLIAAARVRRIAPHIPLVWGAYHPTLDPETTIANPLVDFIVRGEGERTMIELLEALADGDPARLGDIPGLSFKNGAGPVHNPPRPASSVDSYPTPDYALYEHAFQPRSAIPYIASRGCPYDCRFCCSAAINRIQGKRFMRLSEPNLIRDLDFIVDKFDPTQIDFIDDNFLLGRRKIEEFISIYRRQGYTFAWTAFGRCDVFARLDPALLDDLRSVNCRKIFFGVESGSPRILDYIKKRESRAEIQTAVENVARHRINADFTFINGFPTETAGDVRMSINLRNWIKGWLPNATVRFFVFTPLPGTSLYEECVREHGLKAPESLEEWVDFEYHSFRPVWLPNRHRNKINAISWASFFDSFEPGRTMGLATRIACHILKWCGRARMRLGWFGFAPEFLLANRYFTMKSRKYISEMRRQTGVCAPA